MANRGCMKNSLSLVYNYCDTIAISYAQVMSYSPLCCPHYLFLTQIHVNMYIVTLDFSDLKKFQEREVFWPHVISNPLWFSSSISLPSALRGRDVCFAMAITQKSLWWTPPAWRSCTHWSPRSRRTGSAPWASSDPTEHKVRGTGGDWTDEICFSGWDWWTFFLLHVRIILIQL